MLHSFTLWMCGNRLLLPVKANFTHLHSGANTEKEKQLRIFAGENRSSSLYTHHQVCLHSSRISHCQCSWQLHILRHTSKHHITKSLHVDTSLSYIYIYNVTSGEICDLWQSSSAQTVLSAHTQTGVWCDNISAGEKGVKSSDIHDAHQKSQMASFFVFFLQH